MDADSERIVSDEAAVYRVLERAGTVVLPAASAQSLDGFAVDTFSEYRNRSVVRTRLHCETGTASRLTLSNTFAGRYCLAVAMQDSELGPRLKEWLRAQV